MIRLRSIFYLIPMIILFCACEDSDERVSCVEQPDISDIEIQLDYTPLTEEFLNISTVEELREFLNNHPAISQYFLKSYEYPDEQTFVNDLFQRISNPHIDTLGLEVKRVFGDEEQLAEEFREAFRHLRYYYPNMDLPKIKTIATGFSQDLFISDSLIVVGLDYYLGDGAKYRPLNMFEYILERYRPQYIVPSVMLIYGISPTFNKTSLRDKAMLADMVTYGKAFYFAKHMIPCVPDSVLIWYDTEEIKGVYNNANIVWSHFVENELLFETSHELKRKYIEERPKTYEIGESAPGRIGTWLGWQIVRKFMEEREEVTLPELMEIEDPQRIFKEAKYKPQ